LHNGREVPGHAAFEVAAGDRLRIETPGGGGYGA
jgi:N-methylhydantoinase B/oxoprolinase/acetone carboxylase alpha subunit